MEKEKKLKPTRIVSGVFANNTIVESVQEEAGGRTALAISTSEGLSIVSDWTHESIRYVPVPSTHNLLKHRAVRLPGRPLEYDSPDLP